MIPGWHYLDDTDASPPLGSAAFLDVAGVDAGMRSPLRLVRLYAKGRPTADVLADRARTWAARGCAVQCLNEPNHPIEQFNGTPADYATLYFHVKALAPNARLYWAAPSPGFPDWMHWYDGAASADALSLHAYGTFDQMRAIVRQVSDRYPWQTLWISECNFGAGQTADRDAWAHQHLAPFLAWCQTQRAIEAVSYFAYKWDQSPTLPTPVDGAGTAIATVLAQAQPTGGHPVPTIPDRYPHATWIGSPNHWPDRAGQRILAIVDHIADGPQSAIDSHFQDTAPGGNPDDAVSAHFAVNTDGTVHQYVGVNAAAWANGIVEAGATLPAAFPSGVNCNRITVSIEHAGLTGQPIPEAQYQGSLALHVWLIEQIRATGQAFAVNTDRIIGHYRISPQTRAHCPGTAFPFARLLKDVAMIVDPPASPFSIGLGFTQFLKDHPDYGVPRQDEWSDAWGNTFVWLTATPAHPQGPLLVWRKSTVTVDTAFAG